MWEELTIPEKTKVMRFFLQNGISSIDKMKEYYNSASSSNQNTSARKYSGEENTKSNNNSWLKEGRDISLYQETPKDIKALMPEPPVIDKHFTKKYKDLPNIYKKAVNNAFSDMNFKNKDFESLYNSGKYWNILQAHYKGTPSGRIRRNDSPTRKDSESKEKWFNSMIYNNPNNGVSFNQVAPNMAYAVPYEIDKEITIPTIGRVSTNALDSLAKYSFQAEVPLSEALGLSGQETNFGAAPYANMMAIPKEASEEEQEKIRYNNRVLGNTSYFRNFGMIPAEYLVRDFRYNLLEDPIDRGTPPLLHAFNYYKKGLYNTGDPNHTEDVKERGKFIIGTAPVREWINNSPYAQRALQIK